jgi:hypothetical protein
MLLFLIKYVINIANTYTIMGLFRKIQIVIFAFITAFNTVFIPTPKEENTEESKQITAETQVILTGNEKSDLTAIILNQPILQKPDTQLVKVALPLYAEDYYYGKHINASVTAEELNTLPIMKPGDSFSILADGYLTLESPKGYIQPPGDFMYASGACWTVTTFGYLMDEANKEFINKYGEPLFTFGYWDRYGHEHAYRTYSPSNYGYGYSVSKYKGQPAADYTFTVNPNLKEIPELRFLKIQIVMASANDYPGAYNGEAISGYILVN